MSAPGWYPDPTGDPNRVRYWDGTAWSGESAKRKQASPRWPFGLAALVVAALVVGFMLWPRGDGPAAEDTQTARPSGSVWDEIEHTDSPSPTMSPTSTMDSGGETVECPRVTNDRLSTAVPGHVSGGNLAFPVPAAWIYPAVAYSRVLTDQDTATKSWPGSTWTSLMVLGVAPTDAGFTDPRTTANQIIDCHITSANFSGLTGSKVEANEAVTVDGVDGWRVRAHAYTPQAPGGGAVFEVVVMDTGHEDGLSAFWGGVVDADAEALAVLNATVSEIEIVG